jgi:hypothetical protein
LAVRACREEEPVSHASGTPERRRRYTVALLAAAFAFSAAALAVSAQAEGGSKTIYVTALDPLKKPMSGLDAKSWAVQEDGKDRSIVSSVPATDPLDVVLMIDTSVNAQPTISELRAGLQAFAQALFTSPAPVTISIMDVAQADIMVAENKKVLDDVLKTLNKTFPDRAGNTVMLEGIVDAAKKLTKSTTPRRAIVMVNIDGVPDASRSNMSDVIKSVVASNASVWAVTYQNFASRSINQQAGQGNDPSNPAGSGMVGTGPNGQNLDFFLTRAPGGTGGWRDQITSANALQGSLTTIANALLGQYALTYTRPDASHPQVLELGQAKPGATLLYPTTPIK